LSPGNTEERPFRMFLVCSTTYIVFLVAFILHPSTGLADSTTPPGPRPLPYVTREMEKPDYWIAAIRNPNRVLMDARAIQRMNEENLKRQDLWYSDVKELKAEWTREELLTLLKEDWDGFGQTSELRYGRDGHPLDASFWGDLKDNTNPSTLPESQRLLFGLILRRTDLRVFPTEEHSLNGPSDNGFDRFQHSSVSPGTLVGIYHFSRDQKWAYVQTYFMRGWVRREDVAPAGEDREALDYAATTDRLLVTGSFVDIFEDPLLQKVNLTAQMGSSFPLLSPEEQKFSLDSYYALRIPSRGVDGKLVFKNGYVSRRQDVRRGFLPYTQANVARQAFKMLHEPYGWGEMSGDRDCSRFIMDIFGTFGLLLPRNSKYQAMIGKPSGPLEGKKLAEKKQILDRAVPLATLLRLPGHIMLFLGSQKGRYYAIHDLWGVSRGNRRNPGLEKVGRVVVSDLSLGSSGPSGSLLSRLTDVTLIGSP
jgi:hypothetical protein